MKQFSEIKKNFRIKVAAEGEKGFNADITMPHWTGSLVCSVGAGWEHVSVAPYRNIAPYGINYPISWMHFKGTDECRKEVTE